MNVVRCNQGHFYDADKFTACPHCGAEEQEPKRNSSIIRTESTVALKEEDVQAMVYGQEVSEADESKIKHSVGGIFRKKKRFTERKNVDDDIYSMPITISTGAIYNTTSMEQMTSVPVTSALSQTPVMTLPPTGVEKNRGCTVGWLVYLTGTEKGSTCELKSGNNFMGSAVDMDICIKNDSEVALKNHAKIVFEPNKQEFFVAPGDTSELIYVGDDVVMVPQKLSAYDEIKIGNTKMLFVPLCGEMFTWQGEK